jgi:hypothetical protein
MRAPEGARGHRQGYAGGWGVPRLMVAPLLVTCSRSGSWHSRDHSGIPIRSGNASHLPLEVARCRP